MAYTRTKNIVAPESVAETTVSTKANMVNKSPSGLPNNPLEKGYTTQKILKAFTDVLLDSDNSIISELERVLTGLNTNISSLSEDTEEAIEELKEMLENDIGTDSTTGTVKGRIKANETQIAKNVNDIVDLNNAVITNPLNANATIYNTPKGTYSTLTALQTAYPNGTTGIYVVAQDGYWYHWNGSAWTRGNVYQAMSVPVQNSSDDTASLSLTVINNNVYDVENATSLSINLPTSKTSQFYAEINVIVGATISLTYSTSDIVWKGEDLDNDDEWLPSSNTTYLLQIKCNGQKYIINVLQV